MNIEFAAIIVLIAAIGIASAWRDPKSAGTIITAILDWFASRKKPNDIKRDDEDDPRD